MRHWNAGKNTNVLFGLIRGKIYRYEKYLRYTDSVYTEKTEKVIKS